MIIIMIYVHVLQLSLTDRRVPNLLAFNKKSNIVKGSMNIMNNSFVHDNIISNSFVHH